MFKNREFRIRVARINNETELAEPKVQFPKEDITNVAKEILKTSAVCVVSIIAAAAVARTASEIAIHHGTK